MKRFWLGPAVLAMSAGVAVSASRLMDAPSSEVAPDVTLTCSPNALATSSARVAASSAGVAAILRNTAAASVDFDFGAERYQVFPGQERAVVLSTSPGPVTVLCNSGVERNPTTAFEVVDVNGYWRKPSVDCVGESRIVSTTPHPTYSWRRREHGAALAFVALQRDDSVQWAGYRDAAVSTVRVLRGGAVVGQATFTRARDNTVVLEEFEQCLRTLPKRIWIGQVQRQTTALYITLTGQRVVLYRTPSGRDKFGSLDLRRAVAVECRLRGNSLHGVLRWWRGERAAATFLIKKRAGGAARALNNCRLRDSAGGTRTMSVRNVPLV